MSIVRALAKIKQLNLETDFTPEKLARDSNHVASLIDVSTLLVKAYDEIMNVSVNGIAGQNLTLLEPHLPDNLKELEFVCQAIDKIGGIWLQMKANYSSGKITEISENPNRDIRLALRNTFAELAVPDTHNNYGITVTAFEQTLTNMSSACFYKKRRLADEAKNNNVMNTQTLVTAAEIIIPQTTSQIHRGLQDATQSNKKSVVHQYEMHMDKVIKNLFSKARDLESRANKTSYITKFKLSYAKVEAECRTSGENEQAKIAEIFKRKNDELAVKPAYQKAKKVYDQAMQDVVSARTLARNLRKVSDTFFTAVPKLASVDAQQTLAANFSTDCKNCFAEAKKTSFAKHHQKPYLDAMITVLSIATFVGLLYRITKGVINKTKGGSFKAAFYETDSHKRVDDTKKAVKSVTSFFSKSSTFAKVVKAEKEAVIIASPTVLTR